MKDPYAGHRDYDDSLWMPDVVRDTQWTDWDYALVEAATVIENMTSSQSGQLRWLAEDPDVFWEVDDYTDFAARELDKVQSQKKEPEPGLSYYVKNPTKRDGKPFWSISEWLENADNPERRRDPDQPEGARPPTPEEYLKMQSDREERLARFRDD